MIDHFRVCSCLWQQWQRIQFVYLSLSMILDILKCQCSFTLLTNVCIVGGVTSRSILQVFWIFNTKTRRRLFKMNMQLFQSAATGNSKLIYSLQGGIWFSCISFYFHLRTGISNLLLSGLIVGVLFVLVLLCVSSVWDR